MTIAVPTSAFRTYKWIVSATPGFGTHTTIQSAINSSVSGEAIFVRDGTYTENPVLKAGITLEAASTDVTIVGKCSFSGTGIATISNFSLENNGDYIVEMTGANASQLFIENCYFDQNAHSMLNQANSNASSVMWVFGAFLIQQAGFSLFDFSGAGVLYLEGVNSTGSPQTVASTISGSGQADIYYSALPCPITVLGTGNLAAKYCTFVPGIDANAIVFGGTGAGVNLISECNLAGQLVVNNNNAVRVVNASIQSSQTNAIAGTGTIDSRNVVFTGSSSKIQNTLTVNILAGFPDDFSPANIVVSPTANVGNFTTMTAAIAAAVSGNTIWVRAGTYTENWTGKAGVTVAGMLGGEAIGSVTFNGKITFTDSGSFVISGCRLQTNGDFALVVSGANSCGVQLEECFVLCTNNTGISFTNSNAASGISVLDTDMSTSAAGIAFYASSSPGNMVFGNVFTNNSGGTTTPSNNSAGAVNIEQCSWVGPISTSGTAGVGIFNTLIDSDGTTTFTHNGTGLTRAEQAIFVSGVASSISIGAGAVLNASNITVSSSNTNAITGAGTLNYNTISFASTSKTINTTTQNNTNGGSFTPVLAFGGSSVGITYATQIGRYLRTGNTVRFVIDFTLTSKGAQAGVATISGLPFVSVTGGPSYDVTSTLLVLTATPAATTYFFSNLPPASSTLGVFAGAAATGGFTQLDDTHFANNTVVRIQGSYFI